MQENQDAVTNTSGFAQMSLATLQNIASLDGGYNDMAAYIVLCNGVNGRQSGRYCTHGAKSISHRTGMTYRAATKAFEWLNENGFIRPPAEQEPKFLGKRDTRSSTVRWVINDGDCLDVAVSKQFIEGVTGSAKDAPLKRMLAEINGADEIPRAQAVMDAIVLFAALMKEQDFGDCAGVDPDAWHQDFEPIEAEEDGFETAHVVPVPNTNGVMVTVKESENPYSTLPFIYKVFGETPTDEAHKKRLTSRFWHAAHQLRTLRLVYRVMVLWQGNPLDSTQRRRSEPIATQYINDSWARQIDPHLQYETNRAAWRTETRDAYSDFTEDSIPFVGSGRYRYIVRAGAEKTVSLIGQLRVRYWAANESTVQGRVIEKRRTESFLQSITSIGRQ